MDSSKIDSYMAQKGKFFPQEKLMLVRNQLEKLSDDKSAHVFSLNLKDPTTSLILSLFLGNLGVDRFYIGDTGIGIGKLLTCGGAWIWYIVDLFLIMGATREKNFQLLMMNAI